MERTISGMVGKGSVNHNTRAFTAKNVDSDISGAKLGHGVGYRYAHDYPEHYVKQQYLPDEIMGSRFYYPTEIGYEKQAGERIERLRNRE